MGIPTSPIEFHGSPRSSVGIEWELYCVDHDSGDLSPAAPDILAAIGKDDDTFPHATSEFLTNTVEIVSAPHTRVADAVSDLAGEAREVVDAGRDLGVDVLCSGTHPFAQWQNQQITQGNDHYDELLERTQYWGRQLLIWGVHMHIGVDNAAKAIPILNGMVGYYPHFQALSASSPFWTGIDTGYASNRALMFQQIPTAGLPPVFETWQEYERAVAELCHVGMISGPSELHWDLRPSPKWGTIEIRFCDGLSTLRELGALTALAQCLVEEFEGRLDRGEEIRPMQPWFARENKWRGARYGLDAIVIVNPDGDERPVVEHLRETVERLAPIADRLDCAGELNDIELILDRGASYQRQRRIAEAHDGDTRPVVSALVAEFATGEPSTV